MRTEKSEAIFSFGEDDQPLIGGLHDSQLIAVTVSNGLEMLFEDVAAARLRIQIAQAASPYFWSCGVAMPNIVSTVWLAKSEPALDWLASRIGKNAAQACHTERTIFAPNGGWLLALEMIAGSPIVGFGLGDLKPENFQVTKS